jgi:hypothetical protein
MLWHPATPLELVETVLVRAKHRSLHQFVRSANSRQLFRKTEAQSPQGLPVPDTGTRLESFSTV